jgi:hypothetical protein
LDRAKAERDEAVKRADRERITGNLEGRRSAFEGASRVMLALASECRVDEEGARELSHPEGETQTAKKCNGCGKTLLLEHMLCDDGCPCNTPRGINVPPRECRYCKTNDCVKPAHHIAEKLASDFALAQSEQPARDVGELLSMLDNLCGWMTELRESLGASEKATASRIRTEAIELVARYRDGEKGTRP